MPIKMPARRPSPEEFIAGATAASPALPSELPPWLNPRVRDDLRVQVNAKLPEKLMVQVHWLANRLGVKKQDVLESALRAWVADELRKLGLPED
ncbi:MAG TPA: hypothetical protein VE270_03675 [Thermoleophilaceae bacterium]|nr:hypothetical protein [Thermoleophilaceae bacterium]